MRKASLTLASLLVAACSGGGGGGAIDGAPLVPDADVATPDAAPFPYPERPYTLHVPPGYDPAVATPLVMLLHGYGANAIVQDAYFGLGDLMDEEGVLYAMPEGRVDSSGKQFWNATDACCDFEGTGVDDVAYLTAVIDDVIAHYNVDPKRVYLVGHSNGGFMSHRLACDHAERFAAIVSLAGSTWLMASMCQPGEPVAVLQVHGDADTTVPYAGNAGYPSAPDTVARWAATNGCDATTTTTGTLDLDTGLGGAETRVDAHGNCDAAAAELWTIVGGDHVPAFGDTWAPAIWSFLEAHPKP